MELLEIINKFDLNEGWLASYKRYIPLFIQEARSEKDWSQWDPDTFERFFGNTTLQPVASLQLKSFTNADKEKIKKNWRNLAPLLKQIADSQDAPLFAVYQQIKMFLRRYTTQDLRAATNRFIASFQPGLLCTIVREEMLSQLMNLLNEQLGSEVFTWQPTWFENSFNILQYFKDHIPHNDIYDIPTLPWQTYDYLKKLNANPMPEEPSDKLVDLLKYKKQIILQGPPGTGKTKTAKEIAQKLADNTGLTTAEIYSHIKVATKLKSAYDGLDYEVARIEGDTIHINNSEGKTSYTNVGKIKTAYAGRVWETEEIKSASDSYSAAIAKYLNGKVIASQTKIIQFHPSYSYEDFVRGIMAKPNPDGEGLIYEAANKVLAKFAQEALDNYRRSNTSPSLLKQEIITQNNLQKFIDYVRQALAEDKDNKYQLTPNVYLFDADDKKFRYKGDNWTAQPKGLNLKYTELEKLIAAGVREIADIKKTDNIEGSTFEHANYYAKVLGKYDEFNKKQSQKDVPDPEIEPLKNYVLIIDEINRANLSAVLGELIYALEYRGEQVESIYSVNESPLLVLPPNLYLIGTMNTADRSVGHIDYAIRRRFSFVNLHPKDLSDELGEDFFKDLFDNVAKLFDHNTNLSKEFASQDVQLGHSYFIQQYEKDADGNNIEDKPHLFQLRLEHEIKPILLEYVRDGILIGKVNGQSVEKYIQSLTV